MPTYKITEALLNQVLGYLATKPYAETVKLIQAIQTEATAKELCGECKVQEVKPPEVEPEAKK